MKQCKCGEFVMSVDDSKGEPILYQCNACGNQYDPNGRRIAKCVIKWKNVSYEPFWEQQ